VIAALPPMVTPVEADTWPVTLTSDGKEKVEAL
jgi:hypothetical protein